MSEIDDGGNAFPRPEISGYVRAGDKEAELWERQKSGMSMREWYAGMALQGIISTYTNLNLRGGYDLAEQAYNYADAMIKAGKGEK